MGLVLPLDTTPSLPPPATNTPTQHTLKAPGRLPKIFQTADTGNQTSSDTELWKKNHGARVQEADPNSESCVLTVQIKFSPERHQNSSRTFAGPNPESSSFAPLSKEEEESREKEEEDASIAAAPWSETANCDPPVLVHVLIFQCFSPDPLLPQISLVNAASDLFSHSQQSHRQDTREKQVTTLKSTELYFSFPEEGWKNETLDNNNSVY